MSAPDHPVGKYEAVVTGVVLFDDLTVLQLQTSVKRLAVCLRECDGIPETGTKFIATVTENGVELEETDCETRH